MMTLIHGIEKMKEIRIKIDDDINDNNALWMVLQVVMGGKISNTSDGKSTYCWVTGFGGKDNTPLYWVENRPYRKTTMFYVKKDENSDKNRNYGKIYEKASGSGGNTMER